MNDDSTSPMEVGSLIIKENGSVYVLWTNLGSHSMFLPDYFGKVNFMFDEWDMSV